MRREAVDGRAACANVIAFHTGTGHRRHATRHYGYDLWLPNAMNLYAARNFPGGRAEGSEQMAHVRCPPYFCAAAWNLCRRGILRPGVYALGGWRAPFASYGGCGTSRRRKAISSATTTTCCGSWTISPAAWADCLSAKPMRTTAPRGRPVGAKDSYKRAPYHKRKDTNLPARTQVTRPDQGVSILPSLVRRLGRGDLQEAGRPNHVKLKE